MGCKKYVIAWHDEHGNVATFYGGNRCTETKNLCVEWYVSLDKATAFSLWEAKEMLARLSEWYKTSTPNVRFGARIHEFIPASIGDEVKSESEVVIADLESVISRIENVMLTYSDVQNCKPFIEKAIEFLKKNTK